MGSSNDFSPRRFIENNIVPKLNNFTDAYGHKREIAQLIISHPHADHITEISSSKGDRTENRFIDAGLITCPHDKEYPTDLSKEYKDEKTDFLRITNQKDQKWLIDKYKAMIVGRKIPLQTISAKDVSVPNLEYGIYYVIPPACNTLYENDDQKYSNSISIVFYLRHGNQTLLIPGDITPEAFEKVLNCDSDVERRYTNFNSNIDSEDSIKNTGTQSKLGHILTRYGLSILVCPHHGLESGYCTKLYNYIGGGKPYLNIISERIHTSKSEGKIHSNYQSSNGAKGLEVDINGKRDKRYSVTTRGGHILVVFKGTDIVPHVYMRDKPEDLLNIVP